MSKPAWKEGKLQHDIWCLITNTCENRVAIVNSVITRHLTLAKVGRTTLTLQFCSWTIASASALLYVASSLSVICLLLFVILPVVSYLYSIVLFGYFTFLSAFCLFCSFVSSDHLILDYSVLFLSWYQKHVPGISIPNNNHLASQ
jgi:hypothetical protein